MPPSVLEEVRSRALQLWKDNNLLQANCSVRAKPLSVHEAIGDPERQDFPLQKGRERLIEATFMGMKGQAFTDQYGDFSGTLAEVAKMPLSNNFRRAVFVATLNATARALGLCEGTVHCRDEEPRECAQRLVGVLAQEFRQPRVTLVGYQPSFAEALAQHFSLRVIDLDPKNIGQPVSEHTAIVTHIEGPESQDNALAWADVLLVTGSTLVNDTLGDFLGGKPVLFYGTTVAAAAALMGWQRFCAMSA